MSDLLEEEFAPHYQAWKANPGQESNANMLKTLQPTIDQAVRTHVGQSTPLINSQARLMALKSLHTYDPKRARLSTHLFNQLQGLKRVSRKQGQILGVPERVSLDKYHLENSSQELRDELGREPTDIELADHTGFSPERMARVRSYKPAVAEGSIEQQAQGDVLGGVQQRERGSMFARMVYEDLSPFDQKVMELTFGWGGRRQYRNLEIARKLGRSPGYISQRKRYIQQLLDQEQELSPFGG